MVYRAIGLMSGSALEGLDIVFAEFHENAGAWAYNLLAANRYPYSPEWVEKIKKAGSLRAADYLVLHAGYGHYTGQLVNDFIEAHQLQYKVQLVASHGHTVFHMPGSQMTAQLGEGAAIAAKTGINVVSDLRTMDVALGGKGAPVVPVGEELLFADHGCFLHIGTMAHISCHSTAGLVSFDICAANPVLNMLARQSGKPYDDEGKIAAGGELNNDLLKTLNSLEYYGMAYPKRLTQDFATDVLAPLLKRYNTADALRTYVEHMAIQITNAIKQFPPQSKLLVTGGGVLNNFLVARIKAALEPMQIEVTIPDKAVAQFKESLVMALLGILRWREENNVLAANTGASRDSIGGAVWMGQEA